MRLILSESLIRRPVHESHLADGRGDLLLHCTNVGRYNVLYQASHIPSATAPEETITTSNPLGHQAFQLQYCSTLAARAALSSPLTIAAVNTALPILQTRACDFLQNLRSIAISSIATYSTLS